MARARYEHLYSPISIGKVQLQNRIVKTAAQTYLFDSGDRRFGPYAKAFYGAVAKGGVGMIIVETPAMEWPLADEGDRRLRVDDDKYLKDIEELAKTIHAGGIPCFMQFYHRGPWGGIYANIAKRVAASPVTFPSVFDVHEEEPPAALTIDEIEELVERYAASAGRLADCGFDGVEIHAGADHLLDTFLSRFWNRRDDQYGAQNWENRTRFLLEIIAAVRKRCGADFAIQVFLNGVEFGVGDEGLSLDENKTLAMICEKAGADSLHIRSHWVGMHQGSYLSDTLFYPEPHIPLSEFPKEMDWTHYGSRCNLPLATAIKQVVNIPVMSVCGFDVPTGDDAIREGKCDLIGMNRRIFADAEYPNKMRTGRALEVQPCTKCGHCSSTYNVPRHCRINACFGTDSYELNPLVSKKKVLVVGGGPAGMQTARVAAWRGHDVTLWEKGKYLGGSMSLAAMVKGFKVEDVREVIWFLRRQVKKYGVKVQLGKEIDAAAIEAFAPDVVILATGGKPQLPDVPGVYGKNVVRSSDLYGTLQFYLRLLGPKTLRDLTAAWMPVGKSAVIIGGAIQGCQLGEFLVKRGRKVTIVDTDTELGKSMYPERRTRLFYWFDKKGVERLAGVQLVEITKAGLTLITQEGEKRTIEADSVICALPFAGDHTLEDALEGKIPEVYSIGDCEEPGLIPDATSAGWKIGNAI
jgi:2,4-dienoyl-CoA reductase-like NADH-dependent reductase (Old Yellow Enzyme family)/thioredoxin reductase